MPVKRLVLRTKHTYLSWFDRRSHDTDKKQHYTGDKDTKYRDHGNIDPTGIAQQPLTTCYHTADNRGSDDKETSEFKYITNC